jgi:DNA-binding NarL/FixJ family response regulator
MFKLLTARQKEVVRRLVKGWSNKEIARDMNIEPRTVSVHLQNIYPRLGVHSRYAVIAMFRNSSEL